MANFEMKIYTHKIDLYATTCICTVPSGANIEGYQSFSFFSKPLSSHFVLCSSTKLYKPFIVMYMYSIASYNDFEV